MTDSPFAPLLELQQIDIQIAQIRHRSDHLPARAELGDVEQRVATHQSVVDAVAAEHRDVTADHKRLEDELATLEAKIEREDAKLYSGTIQSAKELQSINEELASLKHRQSDFEDLILEVLDRLEPLDARLAELAEITAALGTEHAAATVALAEAEAEVHGELEKAEAGRRAFLADVSAEHLALYEKLRTNVSGNAVALLSGGSCTGCHLALPSAEVARLKKLPPDEASYCEECGALLVR